MRLKVFTLATAFLLLMWPSPKALAGWQTVVWDRAGDPYNYSVYGFTGVYGLADITDPPVTSTGFHVSSIFMKGYVIRELNQNDYAEVGWAKDPYFLGHNNPEVFSAWHWDKWPYLGEAWYPQYQPPPGTQRYFKIQREWDGSGYSWHGYYNNADGYGWRQILWMANRESTAAPQVATERYHQGVTVNGVYYPGDDNGAQFHWSALYRRDSLGVWATYGDLRSANLPSIDRWYSVDPEYDPYKYDNTHFKTYKWRNNPYSYEWADYNGL